MQKALGHSVHLHKTISNTKASDLPGGQAGLEHIAAVEKLEMSINERSTVVGTEGKGIGI